MSSGPTETRGENDDTGITVWLSELYRDKIEPIIRRHFASKFRVSLRPDDEARNNQDALELVSETKLLVLQKLSSSANGNAPDVRDLEAYVRTVASNVFNQYLRRKYPRRLSVKNQIRYLLGHHDSFAIWQGNGGEWTCGHKKDSSVLVARQISLTEEERIELRSKASNTRGRAKAIVEFITHFFSLHPTPILFEDLVEISCEVLQIDEPVDIAEPENLADLCSTAGELSALDVLEDTQFVRRLWEAVQELPIKHRVALLLNFKDDAGESLITMLPVMRIASVRQIADGLGFTHEEMAAAWNELPWDDNRIAERLGVTRQQVINLRQSARQMLRRKIWPSS